MNYTPLHTNKKGQVVVINAKSVCSMEIVNRVQKSALVTIDLEQYYHPGERVLFDISDLLYEGLILREKEFRAYIRDHSWEQYQGKSVALHCSTEAIVPVWAYMLLTTALSPYAHMVVEGDLRDLEIALYKQGFCAIDLTAYNGAKVVIKGCSHHEIPPEVYVEICRLLRPLASSIMYGEPCSTVPIYKSSTQVKK